ncbi:MAG: hypothetical protein IPF64_01145 [Flavobacteriales bacterium]|nr:hypothetical protein [Flavobacteriales bacterium]
MRNDPDTGQFATGNSGRPKGTKNTRTVQWEELGKEMCGPTLVGSTNCGGGCGIVPTYPTNYAPLSCS